MDKQVASKKIAELKSQIDSLYAEIASVADEAGLDYVRYDGPAGYGDGGYYDTNEGWKSSSAEGC